MFGKMRRKVGDKDPMDIKVSDQLPLKPNKLKTASPETSSLSRVEKV